MSCGVLWTAGNVISSVSFRVIDMKSEYVYVIESIAGEQRRRIDAHLTRLSFFSTGLMDCTGDLADVTTRQGFEYDVEALESIV
jgi:hypothetical protein